MREIIDREDIEFLVDRFYEKVVQDELIGHFFRDAVALDWSEHKPIMYDFWESVLVGGTNYTGNPMRKHMDLHRKSPLRSEHFARWLSLWEQTIQTHFRGDRAEEAIQRAHQIGGLMKHKTEQWDHPD